MCLVLYATVLLAALSTGSASLTIWLSANDPQWKLFAEAMLCKMTHQKENPFLKIKQFSFRVEDPTKGIVILEEIAVQKNTFHCIGFCNLKEPTVEGTLEMEHFIITPQFELLTEVEAITFSTDQEQNWKQLEDKMHSREDRVSLPEHDGRQLYWADHREDDSWSDDDTEDKQPRTETRANRQNSCDMNSTIRTISNGEWYSPNQPEFQHFVTALMTNLVGARTTSTDESLQIYQFSFNDAKFTDGIGVASVREDLYFYVKFSNVQNIYSDTCTMNILNENGPVKDLHDTLADAKKFDELRTLKEPGPVNMSIEDYIDRYPPEKSQLPPVKTLPSQYEKVHITYWCRTRGFKSVLLHKIKAKYAKKLATWQMVETGVKCGKIILELAHFQFKIGSPTQGAALVRISRKAYIPEYFFVPFENFSTYQEFLFKKYDCDLIDIDIKFFNYLPAKLSMEEFQFKELVQSTPPSCPVEEEIS